MVVIVPADRPLSDAIVKAQHELVNAEASASSGNPTRLIRALASLDSTIRAAIDEAHDAALDEAYDTLLNLPGRTVGDLLVIVACAETIRDLKRAKR